MHSLRLPGETDQQFRSRAERTVIIANHLIDAALSNHYIQDYIADPLLPYSVDSQRRNPTVRIDYDEAYAICGIGEGLRAAKHKHWGDGPYILPLEPDDPVDSVFVLYVFKQGSRYNRRFEQRRRLKQLLGKRFRTLVEKAKYKRATKRLFLETLTDDEAQAIRRLINVEPAIFWRAARGRIFLKLPPRETQLYLPFPEE